MNLNRALVISLSLLVLFVVAAVFTFSKHNKVSYVVSDSEALIANVLLVPEIIRSYDKVKDIYGKKNSLFFRYVQTSCSSCFDSQLNEILTLQEEIGNDRIWIFPAYPDDRNSRIRLSNELAKYNYRNIPTDSLLIPIYSGEQKSYFAWVNSKGEIDMVFVPDWNKVQFTRKYFIEVKKRLKKFAEENK